MAETPNHDYNTPQKGTADWHVPLNENFKRIDKDLPIRDSEANKGNYEALRGAKYEATDSGAIYYGDGTSWVLADRQVGSVQADKLLVKQLQEEGPRIVSPSAKQGYDSLQAAIDDAAEGGSTVIWLAEDIKENVVIPTNLNASWNDRGGLTIEGIKSRLTMIEDSLRDGTPILDVATEEDADTSNLTLKNLHINGYSDSGRSLNINYGEMDSPRGCPFLSMIECRTETPVVVKLPFFSYYENCTFNSRATTEWSGRPNSSGTVTTDSAFILNGGNLATFSRCTFRSESKKLNYAIFWCYGFNQLHMQQPEFKLRKGWYDTEAPRSVANCLFDGACGDIYLESPYHEAEPDTEFRFARTGDSGSPRSVRMTNTRTQHVTIDQNIAGLYMELDGADNPVIEVNAYVSSDSYVKAPPNSKIQLEGEYSHLLRVYGGEGNSGWNATTQDLPSGTGSSNKVRNGNNFPVWVYHNGGEGIHIVDQRGNENIAPGNPNPFLLPMRAQLYFSKSTPSSWSWYAMEEI
ncbi:hypothetical protein [Salinigranum sp. GCM10025319]|uniref:hypothetical protein n=1 Tax=Salinigranum sp. GCM10025319 TaxID=3252687 RepID=UPI003610CAB3